jgi:required for meiotic nuclear division protein 1
MALAAEWELEERSEALDRKLAMIRETSETILSLVEARRSRGLELAVVLLIATEVITALFGLAGN